VDIPLKLELVMNSVWEEFYRMLDSKSVKDSEDVVLFRFMEEYVEEIIKEEKSSASMKMRLSVHKGYALTKDSGSMLAEEIKKQVTTCDRIIVSPAAPLTCQASRDSRFDKLANSSFLFSETNCGLVDEGRVSIAFGPELASAAEWLVPARRLVLSGRLTYIPFISSTHDRARDSLAKNHGGYDVFSWHPDIFELPIESKIEGDPINWQIRSIAKDWMVARYLGAIQSIPNMLESSLAINVAPSTDIARGYALSKICVPSVSRLTFDQIHMLLEEEGASFHEFSSNLTAAINELLKDVDKDSDDFKYKVEKIQIEHIDVHISRLSRKLQRIEKYESWRLGGYGLTTAILLLLSVFVPASTGIATGTMGGVSLLKLYESMISVLERKDEAIKDDPMSFLARISTEK
jgi:hypothetical protein